MFAAPVRCRRAANVSEPSLVFIHSFGQSVITTLPPTEHTVHTHTLVFFFRAGWNLGIFFCLLAGIALQDDLLVTLRFHGIFLLAQIWMRTDLGDEPDSPRRFRSNDHNDNKTYIPV